ncbi:MAG: FkbM family methyltransferase [Pseudomonadota bacterium]
MSVLQELMSQVASRHLSTEGVARRGLPFSRVVIMGAGQRGSCMKAYFEGLGCRVLGFIDNNPAKQGGLHDGLPIRSVAESDGLHPDVPVFIASHHWKVISAQLLRSGRTGFYVMPGLSFYFMPDIMAARAKEVHAVFDLLADDDSRAVFAAIVQAYATGDDGCYAVSGYAQYHHPQVRPLPGDVVIDGGAFTGDTAAGFAACVGSAGQIVAFEPFADSHAALEHKAAGLCCPCACVNRALWSDERTLRFAANADAPAGNAVASHGAVEVRTTTIDAVADDLDLHSVDLVKLDVEGAEMEALVGARRTIERFRPRLQVCLYHSIEDLWRLPLYLAENHPGYRYYLGHHATDPHETVLYAV